jgi:hypothetical protein
MFQEPQMYAPASGVLARQFCIYICIYKNLSGNLGAFPPFVPETGLCGVPQGKPLGLPLHSLARFVHDCFFGNAAMAAMIER